MKPTDLPKDAVFVDGGSDHLVISPCFRWGESAYYPEGCEDCESPCPLGDDIRGWKSKIERLHNILAGNDINIDDVLCPNCESIWFSWITNNNLELPKERVRHVVCSCGKGYEIQYFDETKSVLVIEDEVS